MAESPRGWVLRALLRVHPAGFRARYAHEILVTIRDQRSAMPNASVGRLWIFWVRVVLDLAGSAMRERVAESPLWTTLPTRRRIARRATGCLLLTYAMGNVAYDVSEPKLSMGWLAILVTALSAIVGACLLRRRSTAVL